MVSCRFCFVVSICSVSIVLMTDGSPVQMMTWDDSTSKCVGLWCSEGLSCPCYDVRSSHCHCQSASLAAHINLFMAWVLQPFISPWLTCNLDIFHKQMSMISEVLGAMLTFRYLRLQELCFHQVGSLLDCVIGEALNALLSTIIWLY